MKLYARLGLTPDRIDFQRSIDSAAETRRKIPDEVAIKNIGPGGLLESNATNHSYVALESYLAGVHDVTHEYALRYLDAAHEYFFGRWRDEVPSGNHRDLPPDREYQDRNRTWARHWLNCLLWCSVLGEWDRLIEFAGYLRDDIKLDFEQSTENRAWLLLVAGKLRGRPLEELKLFSDTILSGKRKREKLLWNVFNDILEEAPDEASASLARYATYYRTAEFPKRELNLKVAYDASFLVHYAEFLDVEIEVPEKLKDHIVRLP